MYRKDSPPTIQSMFNSIAQRYDRTNAILSFSLHKVWNRSLVKHVFGRTPSHKVLVDLCSGTGDVAFEFIKQVSDPCHAYLLDFSSDMLHYAREKEKILGLSDLHQISYVEADAHKIPLSTELCDCATMAYGIRNLQTPSLCIQEVFRVLKPGGAFGILELTRPNSSLLRFGHQIYLRSLMPLMGKWLTDNREAYQYLCRSIESFIEPKAVERLLQEQGFVKTTIHSLAGGIATLILGSKPS